MKKQRVPSVSDRLSPDLRSAKESLISVISAGGGRRLVDRTLRLLAENCLPFHLQCSRNTFAEDTPCDGYVWRDDIERVPFEAMGATSASPISSHSRCSGVLCIEKPEPKRNRASKECSNGNSCLSCCEAVQRLGGPRCRVSRHNQGQRESDAKV